MIEIINLAVAVFMFTVALLFFVTGITFPWIMARLSEYFNEHEELSAMLWPFAVAIFYTGGAAFILWGLSTL